MNAFTTAFIGAGNLAGSIIGGLLASGFDAACIRAADRDADGLKRFEALSLGATGTDNKAIALQADVLVLAVKPQVLRSVCEELAPILQDSQLVISVAAGIGTHSLRDWLGGGVAIARCMPNTPALVGNGATGVYADSTVGKHHRDRVETIMGAVGVVRWVDDESLMHAVTAVSGSGPAYFFQFMQAMIEEGKRMGLDEETARTLCAQTCLGAGRMLASGDADEGELMDRVCSPGGTTERAVATFRERELASTVSQAMQHALARSIEMGEELS